MHKIRALNIGYWRAWYTFLVNERKTIDLILSCVLFATLSWFDRIKILQFLPYLQQNLYTLGPFVLFRKVSALDRLDIWESDQHIDISGQITCHLDECPLYTGFTVLDSDKLLLVLMHRSNCSEPMHPGAAPGQRKHVWEKKDRELENEVIKVIN